MMFAKCARTAQHSETPSSLAFARKAKHASDYASHPHSCERHALMCVVFLLHVPNVPVRPNLLIIVTESWFVNASRAYLDLNACSLMFTTLPTRSPFDPKRSPILRVAHWRGVRQRCWPGDDFEQCLLSGRQVSHAAVVLL